ncbi:MAG: HlyD family efflux transporter periplasmic adaptor subunit [Pseudomonadota bacterium]
MVLTAPHALNTISESAVVNAPVVSIKAPFDGVLVDRPRRKGDAIPAQTSIVAFEARHEDRGELERLAARADYLGEEQRALRAEISELRALDGELARRADVVLSVASDVLRLDQAVLESRVVAARHRLAFLADEGERLERLNETGAVSVTRVEEARADIRAQQGLLEGLEIELARAGRQIRAVEEGALPAFGSEDGSYARQRRDEIAIRIADLETRAALAGAEVRRVAAEQVALAAHIDARSVFAPRSDAGALAWTASPTADSPVARGDEILQVLDCSRRFLEVTLPETRFEAIDVGETAWVRLRGSEDAFVAPVESVQGAGATVQTGRVAAQPPLTTQGNYTLVLRLPAADVSDADVATRFCDVGRTAQVRFERGGPVEVLQDLSLAWGRVKSVVGDWFAADETGPVETTWHMK